MNVVTYLRWCQRAERGGAQGADALQPCGWRRYPGHSRFQRDDYNTPSLASRRRDLWLQSMLICSENGIQYRQHCDVCNVLDCILRLFAGVSSYECFLSITAIKWKKQLRTTQHPIKKLSKPQLGQTFIPVLKSFYRRTSRARLSLSIWDPQDRACYNCMALKVKHALQERRNEIWDITL